MSLSSVIGIFCGAKDKTVCQPVNKFRIGWFGDVSVPIRLEVALPDPVIPAQPCFFDGIADGTFHVFTVGVVSECHGDSGIQFLGNGLFPLFRDQQNGFPEIAVAIQLWEVHRDSPEVR